MKERIAQLQKAIQEAEATIVKAKEEIEDIQRRCPHSNIQRGRYSSTCPDCGRILPGYCGV